jgi:hypothetical protein
MRLIPILRLLSRRDARFRIGLAALIAAHLAADVLAAWIVRAFLGRQEFEIVGPAALGLLGAQGVLLAHRYSLVNDRRSNFEVIGALSWLGLIVYLGAPAFRATGAPNAFSGLLFFQLPLLCTGLIDMLLCKRGYAITRCDAHTTSAGVDAFQFSLWQLFAVLSGAAVVLALARLARTIIDSPAVAAALFGILPLASALGLVPLLAPWAALGARRPVPRCIALNLLAVFSALTPAFVGKATLWVTCMIVSPVITQALVVTGSLLAVRRIGYRFVDRSPANLQLAEHPQ